MGMILVKNTKLGFEREMTQTSFDYLSSKKRGFEFVRKIVEPGSIEEHKERLKAEKAAKDAEQNSTAGSVSEQNSTVTAQVNKGGRPKKQTV